MNIGEKIKNLRIKNDLTQEELAGRCELTKGFISQLERDLTSPSISTLVDILDGLGTNLSEFFKEEEEEQIVFSEKDYFELEDEELNNILRWIIPNAQKNNMEAILLELKEYGRTKIDTPHEGEELGYIIEGNIRLYIGKKEYDIKTGESFYYKANEEHYIENLYKENAKILWISTPPSF